MTPRSVVMVILTNTNMGIFTFTLMSSPPHDYPKQQGFQHSLRKARMPGSAQECGRGNSRWRKRLIEPPPNEPALFVRNGGGGDESRFNDNEAERSLETALADEE